MPEVWKRDDRPDTNVKRIDRLTRRWWRLKGRPVALAGEHAWLDAPHGGAADEIGDAWLADEADRLHATLEPAGNDAGLLASMATLNGPEFDASRLDPIVADFYENTSRWRMEVWSEWEPAFRPGGEFIATFFGRRVRQLAIPTRPLDLAHGMTSEVRRFVGRDGTHLGSAWLRRLRTTGDFIYSGFYRQAYLPGEEGPVVHVTFPLPHGNIQVFLQPTVAPDGSLVLSSPGRYFGGPGAYVVVDEAGMHAALVPLRERFHVYTDAEGTLRTDHELRLWRWRVLRLHYRLDRH